MTPLIVHLTLFVLSMVLVFALFVLLGFSLSEGRAGGGL